MLFFLVMNNYTVKACFFAGVGPGALGRWCASAADTCLHIFADLALFQA